MIAAANTENDCKISDFQEISKRKSQKTPTFFVILIILRNFVPDFNKLKLKN